MTAVPSNADMNQAGFKLFANPPPRAGFVYQRRAMALRLEDDDRNRLIASVGLLSRWAKSRRLC